MKVLVLQHVRHEGPAALTQWAQEANIPLSTAFMGENGLVLPDPASLEGLIILGGPMNVDEEAQYPWMTAEKRLIEAALGREVPVLGICLGAQLMADVLGARVGRHVAPEIGWFDVYKTPEAAADARFDHWPDRWTALHWHGDAFEIPAGATHVAQSDACAHQAYLYGENALAFQCHPEVTPQWLAGLTQLEYDALRAQHARYPDSVQSPEAILAQTRYYDPLKALLPRLLDPIFLRRQERHREKKG